MYLLVLTFTKTTVMRHKFLFLTIILACVSFVGAFGQKNLSENTSPSQKNDTLSVQVREPHLQLERLTLQK